MCWELPPTNVTASGVRGVEGIVDGCEHHWDQVRRAPGRHGRQPANARCGQPASSLFAVHLPIVLAKGC